MPGTNDQPGDYRASGCTACHVVYANDRAPRIPRNTQCLEIADSALRRIRRFRATSRAIPIRHEFTRSIPSSQCMVCHVHPGTNMMTTYFGYTWWDNESDGEMMYPKQQHNPSDEEKFQIAQRNPEGAAARGLVVAI